MKNAHPTQGAALSTLVLSTLVLFGSYFCDNISVCVEDLASLVTLLSTRRLGSDMVAILIAMYGRGWEKQGLGTGKLPGARFRFAATA